MEYEIVQVCTQTLYTPIPTMISEATLNFKKTHCFWQFPMYVPPSKDSCTEHF